MIANYLKISTAHILPEHLNDDELLKYYTIADYPDGVFLWAPLEDDPELPEYINTIFRYAIENDCTLIKVDSAEDIIDELENFLDEWT